MWESKAKEEALKDARNQIEVAAKINRLKVGKLVTLTDVNSIPSSPPGIRPMMLKGEEPTSIGTFVQDKITENIFYSEQTVKISSSYNATYELY